MSLASQVKQPVAPKTRDWNSLDMDRAYMSHHHTLEVVDALAFEHGFFSQESLHSPVPGEYRNTYISMEFQIEFSVSTVVAVDSSTYTYIHPYTKSSVSALPLSQVQKLSNADIRRPEDRARRSAEITAALEILKVIPAPPPEPKKKRGVLGGPVSRRDPDGTYVLDYTGVRNGKIAKEKEHTLDYSKINRPNHESIQERKVVPESDVGSAPSPGGELRQKFDPAGTSSGPAPRKG